MKLKSKTQMRIGMSIMIIPFVIFMFSLFSLIFASTETSENITFSIIGYSMVAMALGGIIGFLSHVPFRIE
jgi:hypothetical protein